MPNAWHMPSLSELARVCTQYIAEVDDAYTVCMPWKNVYAATVYKVHDTTCSAYIPELNRYSTLSARDVPWSDAWYLVYIDDTDARWMMLSDVGGKKEQPFPPVWIKSDKAQTGAWREDVPYEDYVLDIDNTAITHRPDLWGHAGWARELAAVYRHTQATEAAQSMYAEIPISSVETAEAKPAYAPRIHVSGCNYFVTYHISHVTSHASLLDMAVRLAMVDIRPHHFLVDLTNFVMCDIGQPMHAFDADKLPAKELHVRSAGSGETIQALDSTCLTLTSQDMVVASGQTPLSVAGVIGGAETGITHETQSVLLEAAHFDPYPVRQTASRIQRRTESSARFEKYVDPYATQKAIRRYVHLLQAYDVTYQSADTAYAAGTLPEPYKLHVTHAYMAKRIGTRIDPTEICHIMHRLGFQVARDDNGYVIQVPTYRMHDVSRKEDVIEEIARHVGYDQIPLQVPHQPMHPHTDNSQQRVMDIKQHCAYALSMREVATYALYDEQWLSRIGWQPEHAVAISNPVSEHMYRLVTTLVPQLMHLVYRNAHMHDEIRCFEWARTWQRDANAYVDEQETLAGLIYHKRSEHDFYSVKHMLSSLFRLVNMRVAWQKCEGYMGLCDPDATARLMYEVYGHWYHLGYVGRVADEVLSHVADGHAYIYELSGYTLRTYQAPDMAFLGVSAYQPTWFDVSVAVPDQLTVADLERAVMHADDHIYTVYVVDIYEKPTVDYARAITLRVWAGSYTRTLSRDDIAHIQENVYAAIRAHGGDIR